LQDHLIEMGAMIEDGTPTVAGMLLFGKHPQTFLPQSGVIFVKFLGKEARGRDGLAGYGRRIEIEGPVARMIERAWQVVNEEMRVEAVVNSLRREETEFPHFAVRGPWSRLCHRDYRLSGRRSKFGCMNRLEVIIPAAYPAILPSTIFGRAFSQSAPGGRPVPVGLH
jgi:ATP-dependent DNA helicase RecG